MNAKQQIEECRRLFGKPPRGVFRILRAEPRHSFDLDCGPDQPPANLLEPYRILLEHGQVVWAAVVRAHPESMQYGSTDHPATIVYSLDPFFDGVPGELENVAHAIAGERFAVAPPACDSQFQNVPVSEQHAPHHPVLFTWTLVHRRRLPTHYLASLTFPLLVSAHRTPVSMILPLRYWPRDLQNAWHHLNRQHPPASTRHSPTPGSA